MSSDNEKKEETGTFIENKRDGSPVSDLESIPEQGTAERAIAERKLVRKLDMRMLPTIVLIYIMNYIDVSPLHALIFRLMSS